MVSRFEEWSGGAGGGENLIARGGGKTKCRPRDVVEPLSVLSALHIFRCHAKQNVSSKITESFRKIIAILLMKNLCVTT